MYHQTTSDNTTINGIRYAVTHTEGIAADFIMLRDMQCKVLGELLIDHNTESAALLINGETTSINYWEAGEADIYEAARIIEANL